MVVHLLRFFGEFALAANYSATLAAVLKQVIRSLVPVADQQ
jgi:hypothetical protein